MKKRDNATDENICEKRILFDICHPAHVHLFRNYINYLKNKDCDVTVVSRDKDVTNQLLDEYGIEYISLSRTTEGFAGKFLEFISRTRKILKLNKEKRFDFAFGTSVSIGFLSLFSNVKSYVFNEDDDATVPLFCMLGYPFATKICNPECIKYRKWKNKRLFFNSYHELAYLHPANFAADKKVLEKYSLKQGKYAVVRLSALQAHHDKGAKGITQELLDKIIKRLKETPIIILKEGGAQIQYNEKGEVSNFKFKISDSHNLLAFAKILISDSQTMSIEAAVLGVPSVRITTFTDKSSVLQELEEKYQLTRGFFPQQEDKVLAAISEIVDDAEMGERYEERRTKMLSEKTDLNEFLTTLL